MTFKPVPECTERGARPARPARPAQRAKTEAGNPSLTLLVALACGIRHSVATAKIRFPGMRLACSAENTARVPQHHVAWNTGCVTRSNGARKSIVSTARGKTGLVLGVLQTKAHLDLLADALLRWARGR